MNDIRRANARHGVELEPDAGGTRFMSPSAWTLTAVVAFSALWLLVPLVAAWASHSGRLDPFLAGVGAELGLSPAQWRELGAAVEQIHAVPLTPALIRLVGREPFRPSRCELLAELDALLTTIPAPADPLAGELAAFWRSRRGVIHALAERADALGRQLKRSGFPQVLCHADLHTWNVLVDAEQRLWIVDWDEAILAPKERDLMFVVRGIVHGLVRPRDTACFFQGYGEANIDPRLLAYYRAAWAVQDIASYGQEALLMPALGEETRRAAVAGLMGLFEPGNIIDVARALDAPHQDPSR